MGVTITILFGLAVLGAIILFKGLTIVGQSETVVIERLGSFHRTLDHGINFIVPFFDQPVSVTRRNYEGIGDNKVAVVKHVTRLDLREMVLDFPGQPVVTKDNASIKIDGVLYYQISDAVSAAYKVENLVQAIEVLAKTTLRSVIGTMELDKVFESREEINSHLQTAMDEASNNWGVKVTRVEIQDIEIPQDIKNSLQKQVAAERERRAAVTEAEGQKKAAILKAEGEKEAQVLVAEGDRDATVARAEGERDAINKLVAGDKIEQSQAIAYLLGSRYIEQLPNIAQQGDRVFLPLETTALMSSVGSLDQLMNGLGLGRASTST